MLNIVLRVLDGADRGRVFDHLQPPVTIGREEGNLVQLNDERISRFHLKIQEDHDQLVLTDLESTNGTRVNGRDTRLRILRFGDVINVGRSSLLFGSREQITQRLADLREGSTCDALTMMRKEMEEDDQEDDDASSALAFDLSWMDAADGWATLHTPIPPDLPESMAPAQAAQLSELFEYFHLRVGRLLASVATDELAERVTLDIHRWQAILDLQDRLANYIRKISEPEE